MRPVALAATLAALVLGAAAPAAEPGARVRLRQLGEHEAVGAISFEIDAGSRPNRVEVRVVANEVLDLYGVSFDLRYPHRLLKFVPEESSEGTFLSESGEAETVFLLRRKAPRAIIVGLSRQGPVPGVDGSGTLATFTFQVRDGAQGRGQLLFLEKDALDSSGAILSDTEFVDGSLQVSRR